METREHISTVISNLIKISNHQFTGLELRNTFDHEVGLCTNIFLEVPDEVYELVSNFMDDWEHGSGDIGFPIKHHLGASDFMYWSTEDKYDINTQYGLDRCKLAGDIAKFLQELLDKEQEVK